MLHAFVDESYTDDWFFMAAAIASNQRQIVQLEHDFRELLREESERLLIPCPTEVHGYELFQGSSIWGGAPLHERLSIAGKVLSIVAENDVRFIVRGIDRAAQRRRYPQAYEPYPMILTHVMREVDRYAKARRTEATLICDEIEQHDRHRSMLERHRVRGTPGYNTTTLSAVVGSLEFVKSETSAMVQAADIVAYLRHRMASVPEPIRAQRRSREKLWSIISGQVEHDFIWVP